MLNIAIFVSGNGSNAENIITTFADSDTIKVSLVVSNKADAYGLTRAQRLGVESLYISNQDFAENPAAVLAELEKRDISMIVLAGFMRKIHDKIVDKYRDRILNIHPSLLPAYGGKGMWGHHVHEAVIAAGEKESGATVHIVSEHIDSGAIVMQGRVEVTPTDTAATLEAKVHQIEYEIYPKAILALAAQIKYVDSSSNCNVSM
jgi:phosphoribosylglycinamide formyltransferase-1